MKKKIGIIVEGVGEIDALQCLIEKIESKHEIKTGPLIADLQPKAAPNVIARSARAQVMKWHQRGINCIVVLIDKEGHHCAVEFAAELNVAFSTMYAQLNIDFRVVVKNSTIENWLIADPQALKKMSARFKVTQAFERMIAKKDCDDIVDAIDHINKIAVKKRYHKGEDPVAIFRNQDPLQASKRSRSYRKFLRALGCSSYADQSKLPFDAPRLMRKIAA